MQKLWPIIIVSLVVAFISEQFNSYVNDKYGEKKYIKKDRLFYFILIILMAGFAGLRIAYNDTGVYRAGYEQIPLSLSAFGDIEWKLGSNFGFHFVNTCIRLLGFSTQSFIMIYSVFTISVYLWFIRKYSCNIWMSVFFIITMGGYAFALAAIKQCVAVAISLIGIDRLLQNKKIPFIICIVIACTFHPYAFLFLICPILTFSPWSHKSYILLLVAGIVAINMDTVLGAILDITSMMGEEYDVTSFTGEGVNIFRVLVVWIPVLLSFLAKSMLKESDDKKANLFINLSMINAEIMFIGIFGTANYFARLANYFLIFQTISLPYIFRFYTKESKKFLKIGSVAGFLLYFYYANAIAGSFDYNFARTTLSRFLNNIWL